VGGMDKECRPLWRLFSLIHDSKKSVQLTCEECIALLDYDTGLLATGIALDEIRPSVNHHLSLFSECPVRFGTWLENLERDTESSG